MSETSTRPAQISDVARTAGVSVGTVSNVLNHPDKVADTTRARVQRVMAELRFVPNVAARQLRGGANLLVGALLPDLRNPFFTDLARGLQDRLAEDGHLVMLAASDDDPERSAMFLRRFAEHGVTRVVAVPAHADLSPYTGLRERGVRVVLADHPSTEPGISSVAIDDVFGGSLAAAHLLERGHRRIWFFNGPPTIRQATERRAGVDRAVRAAGLDPLEVVHEVIVGTRDASGGEAALVNKVNELGRTPEAVMCVNDLVAIGVQRALRRHGGTALATSVDVVGYDDIEVARELAIPLTSVRQPAYEMGRRAAELLLAETATAEHVVFQPELVVRASSVTPRA